ncbi:hypothetical protein LGQ03_15835 [Loktanella sp. TSTF-M6]|uniref:Uncharacterized protein n=1 Tax=Loktanella gaetbuli TaxID=2881335 RepID=A0ABS8BY88_9RHOB|nr:hypothetical protein [Loktanella gaetbuli]MCB5200708.1 hypothetical protein [Loktanella gaetbuli]
MDSTMAPTHDLTPLAPRPAPLDMPRQVLEHAARPSTFEMFSRLFLRNV